MQFKIKDIPGQGIDFEEQLGAAFLREALDGTDAEVPSSVASVRLHLSRHDEDIFVRGDLATIVTVPCGSCLRPTQVRIKAPLSITYVPPDAGVDAENDPLEDIEVSHHDRVIVDLQPMLRELLILSLPMAPRCREDCAGLCSVCGQDKNEHDCGHTTVLEGSGIGRQLEKLRAQFSKSPSG